MVTYDKQKNHSGSIKFHIAYESFRDGVCHTEQSGDGVGIAFCVAEYDRGNADRGNIDRNGLRVGEQFGFGRNILPAAGIHGGG